MNDDPLNQQPFDTAWLHKVDEVSEEAAKSLDCFVILVAVQNTETGKTGVSLGGVPTSGPFAEAAKNVPRLLHTIAQLAELQQTLAVLQSLNETKQ